VVIVEYKKTKQGSGGREEEGVEQYGNVEQSNKVNIRM